MNSQAKPPRRLFAFRAGAQLRGRYGIGADVRDSGPGPSHRPKLLSIRRGTRSPIDFGASGRMLPGRSFRDTRKVAPLHPFQPAIVPAVRSFDSRFASRYAQAFRVELTCVRRFFPCQKKRCQQQKFGFLQDRKNLLWHDGFFALGLAKLPIPRQAGALPRLSGVPRSTLPQLPFSFRTCRCAGDPGRTSAPLPRTA